MSKGRITRENVLNKAFELASENGLESLTIGELAKQCGLSKSGLFAHFNAKENLQIAVLEHAHSVFTERVITPARLIGDENIEAKLRVLLEHWLGWNHSFQGSCMFLDAWKDAATCDCAIQKVLKKTIATWIHYLQIQIQKGVDSAQFHPKLDVKQAAYELYGLYLSAHLFYSIYGQMESYQHFWKGVGDLMSRWRNTVKQQC